MTLAKTFVDGFFALIKVRLSKDVACSYFSCFLDVSGFQINVLLQAYISQLKLEGFALMADMVYVTQVGFLSLSSIDTWAQIHF